MTRACVAAWFAVLLGIARAGAAEPVTPVHPYTIVDTGQRQCYDNTKAVPPLKPGEAFYGQDAQYAGAAPRYRDEHDGTVTDLNTGLIWQKTPDFKNRRTWAEARKYAAELRLAGHDDWRVPSIKELYSLILFTGSSSQRPPVPYLDTGVFDFQYPEPDSGLRLIDAQYWSSTPCLSRRPRGETAAYGVNFADGRIKGYPTETGRDGQPMRRYIRCVRGPVYGNNDFVDNGDGTITDRATGLMWAKADSGKTLNWEQALAYAEEFELAGHDDWRLPNAKELQSLVDYTRAPDAPDPARRGPALDPIFSVTETESWFWTGTTHLDGRRPDAAVYVCFGQAFGLPPDPRTGKKNLVDVHGAGAQRSDPKSGDPAEFAEGRGPQFDQVRILNYARAVRNIRPEEVRRVTPEAPAERER
jgi:hypothetical protein